MEKVKKLISEHKYGLIFFGVLLAIWIYYNEALFSEYGMQLLGQIYAVDFSFGFCTKLLPGAIYNLIFDGVSAEKVSFFIQSLLILCFGFMAVFSENTYKKIEHKNKSNEILFIICILVGMCVCILKGGWLSLLDIHWFFAALVFFLCLKSKYVYILIPLTFLYSVMCYYASALCYIPMFMLVLLYKIFSCKDKKEKVFLWIILAVSFLLSAGLTVYMLMYELSNMKYTMEEFNAILAERGATQFEYYNFSFFRNISEKERWLGTTEEVKKLIESGKIIEVDVNQQNKFFVAMQTIVQQIQVHLLITNHKAFIMNNTMHFPLIIGIFTFIFSALKEKAIAKAKKFVLVNGVFLFFVSLILSFLLSTDTERWFGHSTATLIMLFAYIIYKDYDIRQIVFERLKKTHVLIWVIYINFYVNALFV